MLALNMDMFAESELHLSARRPLGLTGLARPRETREESFHWGCVAFRYHVGHSRAGGRPAMQCICPRRSHWTINKSGGWTFCQKTLNFSGLQQRADVIQLLQIWVLAGLRPKVKTKTAHKRVGIDDVLPMQENPQPPQESDVPQDELVQLAKTVKKRKMPAPVAASSSTAAPAAASSSSSSGGSSGSGASSSRCGASSGSD
eukprot:4634621-Heterocapsa_arctica.AAC.1